VHAVQRGHSREPVFYEERDYRAYLKWLRESAARCDCAVHAYVLMTNHVHILATPRDEQGISRMMQYLGRYYVPYINQRNGASGSLWEGRYKASLVHEADYLLACMRYIELNPVRAGMVRHPRDYPWSSYRANAEGREDDLITLHEEFLRLGKTVLQRKKAYLDLFRAEVGDAEVNQIRTAWQTGTPLGNVYFKEKVERKLKLKVGQNRRGRPKRSHKKGSDPLSSWAVSNRGRPMTPE